MSTRLAEVQVIAESTSRMASVAVGRRSLGCGRERVGFQDASFAAGGLAQQGD